MGYYQTRGKWRTKSGQEIDFLQFRSRDPSDLPDITKIYLHGDTLVSMGYCLSKNEVMDNPFCNLLEFVMTHPSSKVAMEVFSGFFENITESRTEPVKDNSYREGKESSGNGIEKNGFNNFSDKVRNSTNKKPIYTFVKHLNDDIDIVKIEVKSINEKTKCDNDMENSFNYNVPKNNFNKRKHKVKREPKAIKTEDGWLSDNEFICSMYDDTFESNKHLKPQVNECLDSQDDVGEPRILSDEEAPSDHVLNELKFKCKLCHVVFMIKEDLKAHVVDLHDTNIANTCICSQCGFMYKNEKTKIRHEKKFHGIQNYTNDVALDKSNICPTCGVELCNRWGLENHLKVNHENAFEEPKRCHYYDESGKGSACKKKFLTPYALEMHTSHYHKDGPESTSSICHYCSEVFKGAKSYVNTRLKTHIEKVHLGIRHTCKECDKVFMSIKTLKKHQKHVHRKEGHYPCKECGKVFKYYSAAQEHAYVDRGETPYMCKFCDFKSAHSWALAKHRPVCKFAEKTPEELFSAV